MMGEGKATKKLFTLSKTALGDLIVGLAFERFSSLLPVKRVAETDKVIAFWHPRPSWEKHILIVPKKPIKGIQALTDSDIDYIAAMYAMVNEIVKKEKLEKEGYSLICNGGQRQEVHQLHFHLTSGALLGKGTDDE
jgi:histidine triad (HIT) family protein